MSPPRTIEIVAQVRKRGTFDEDEERIAYWLSRPPEERMAGMEDLRRDYYGENYADGEFPKVARVIKRSEHND